MASGSNAAANAAAVPAPATLGVRALTYGIELEFVLAFAETEIVHKPGNRIRKNLTYSARRARRYSRITAEFLPNRVYNSWGIRSEEEVLGYNLNPYDGEPQAIIQETLRQKCPNIPIQVENSLTPLLKTALTYQKWMVTPDHSVCGVGSENIAKWLPESALSRMEADSYGGRTSFADSIYEQHHPQGRYFTPCRSCERRTR